MEMSSWLPQPVTFTGSRDFDCEGFDAEQCQYYKQRWHNWYVADWTFALPTVAFFMCSIGIFIIGYALTQTLALFRRPGPSIWRRCIATIRYLSYRGFHVKTWEWNSAPVGLLLLGLVGTLYFFCMDLVPSPYYWPGTDTVWGDSPPLGTRSGWLALACMPFLFATATKANWITLVTGVPHEKLQVFHRWIAYAFFLLALMHTFPFIVWHFHNGDMIDQFTMSNVFEYWTGVVALIFQAWLTGASWGPIRNLGYEFFKAAHFFTVVLFMVVFFWHCSGTLTSWHYFVATAAVYVPCWAYPWIRTLFQYGVGQKANIFIEDNGFTRITIPANFKWQPGQHCFLRFRGFGVHALSSHPFTICSIPSTSPELPSQMTFYVRHRGGFTRKLFNYAMKQPNAEVPVLVDGPYGGIDNKKFFSSDRLVVIAGGSGAGWMLPFVRQFLHHVCSSEVQETLTGKTEQQRHTTVESPRQQTVRGPRSLRLILATRDTATREWFHTTLDTLRSEYDNLSASADLSVEVHLTGEAQRAVDPLAKSEFLERTASLSFKAAAAKRRSADQKEMEAEVVSGEEVPGRPDLPLIIEDEAAAAASTGKAVGVFVCGPITMQNDVRNAVARENLRIMKNPRSGGMYLHLEHFSWA